MNEEITLRLETFNDKEYILADDCIKAIGIHRKTNSKLREEIERLNNIINELEKWIDEYYKSNRKWYNTELSSHDKRYYEREYINTEAMLVKFDKQLKELKGADKE